MKGFIEVKHSTDGKKELVNIDRIVSVCDNLIWFDLLDEDWIENKTYIECKEDYNEIKRKIREAIKG